MGVRRIRRMQRQEDMKVSRRVNGVAKKKNAHAGIAACWVCSRRDAALYPRHHELVERKARQEEYARHAGGCGCLAEIVDVPARSCFLQ